MLLAITLLWGCSTVTSYNPAHISDVSIAEHERLQGKALIFTEKSDDAYVYVGSPTSLTGSATTLSMEIGKMTREIADEVFDDFLSEGAETKNTVDAEAPYELIIVPKVTSFNYEYNQLKNLGFAITPQINMSLNVCLIKPDGTVYFEKDYMSETVSGDSYLLALENPGEKINRVAHVVLYDLMVDAAEDILDVAKRHPD
jgi:hypothetical protein